MAECFWLVSGDPDDETEEGSLQLVECRDTWQATKRRLHELLAQEHRVDCFDDDGWLLWSEDTHGWFMREGKQEQMSAPRVAGFYRWTEAGHVRVDLPPLDTWRRTAPAITRQRRGRPD